MVVVFFSHTDELMLMFFNWKQNLIIDGNAVTSPILDVREVLTL